MTIPRPADPLFFLDYDGTLAPIVDDPAQAVPHPAVPVVLHLLAEDYPLWLVSGRDIAALAGFLPGLDLHAIGLHGAEEGKLGGPVRRPGLAEHAGALARLRASVPSLPGVTVEDKGASFAVHYRQADDEAAAQQALDAWVASAPDGLEPMWGKKVVELRVRGISKGTAVARIAQRNPKQTPVYLGDDVTDEDAFRALHASHPDAVTVKVGEGETVARYRLPDVDAVVEYLRDWWR